MSSQDLRKCIIDWIKLISSEKEQLEFERNAAGDIAGDELIEVWFDSYHPETLLHQRAFVQAETDAMNLFHQKFDKCASELPAKLKDLRKTKEWPEIMQSAKEVISKCGW